MSRKKRTIRRQVPKTTKKAKRLWGLEVRTFNHGVRPFIDQDYVKDLNDAEKAWLSEFNESYYGNVFPKKKKGRKTNMFDKAGVPRTEIYNQTNSRNRDVHTKFFKINADSGYVKEDDSKQSLSVFDKERENIENELIECVDYRRFYEQFREAGYGKTASRREALRMIDELNANKT